MNNKYYIETYGCQMNVYDSELIASQLINTGYKETSDIENADIILLNTCFRYHFCFINANIYTLS